MTGEWIRFSFAALFLISGIAFLYIAILGTFRFDFALNRIHSAGIVDTMALLSIVVGCMIWAGWDSVLAKYLLLLALQWCSSPVTTHMLTKMEYLTDTHLKDHCALDSVPEKKEENQ